MIRFAAIADVQYGDLDETIGRAYRESIQKFLICAGEISRMRPLFAMNFGDSWQSGLENALAMKELYEVAAKYGKIEWRHILGNHGMTHASLPTLSDEDAKKEIMSLHDYVMENYGYEMQYFRCPCGEYSERALETAKNCGYKTLFWSSAYVDWNTNSQPSPAEGLKKLGDAAHGGEILLLHSVSATNAEILGQLIDDFRAKGFEV